MLSISRQQDQFLLTVNDASCFPPLKTISCTSSISLTLSHQDYSINVLFSPQIPTNSFSTLPNCFNSSSINFSPDPLLVSAIISTCPKFIITTSDSSFSTPFVQISKNLNCCFICISINSTCTLNLFSPPPDHLIFPNPFFDVSTTTIVAPSRKRRSRDQPNPCYFCQDSPTFKRDLVVKNLDEFFVTFPLNRIVKYHYLFVPNIHVNNLASFSNLNLMSNFIKKSAEKFFSSSTLDYSILIFERFFSRNSKNHGFFDFLFLHSSSIQLIINSFFQKFQHSCQVFENFDLSTLGQMTRSKFYVLFTIFTKNSTNNYLFVSDSEIFTANILSQTIAPFLDEEDPELNNFMDNHLLFENL
ncbi:hypothetical protein RCL1_001804 [Eukaryota sp. TZLM3-RCL]